MRRLALVQLVALVFAAGPVLGAPTALVVEILRPAGGEPYLTVSVQKRIGSFQIPCGRAGVVLAGPQGLSLTTVADLSGNARFLLTEIPKALKSQPEQIPLTATVSSEQAQITETITMSYKEIGHYLEAAAESLVAEGNRLAKGGGFKEALEKYRKALALYPNSARASYNIGLAYEKLGMMYLAVSGYSEYLVNHPEAEDRLAVERQVVELVKGMSPRPLIPAGAATLMEEGRKAVASRNYLDALRSYERAQSFAPWWPEPLYSAGLVLEHLGYQNSVTYFTPAIQHLALFLEAADPKDARVAEVRQKIEVMKKIDQELKAPATMPAP
jgi:tetratricopeptide (TPR) repeat protein